jgi:hypothetical protein
VLRPRPELWLSAGGWITSECPHARGFQLSDTNRDVRIYCGSRLHRTVKPAGSFAVYRGASRKRGIKPGRSYTALPRQPPLQGQDRCCPGPESGSFHPRRAPRRGGRGGFKYNPTTSRTLASKFGAWESLNFSARWGCRSRRCQARCTVMCNNPKRWPRLRVLQRLAHST